MSDGMLDDLTFEQQIAGLNDRELMEFTARQVFGMAKGCSDHETRIQSLEGRGPRMRAVAGIGGFAGSVIAGAIYGIITAVKGNQ